MSQKWEDENRLALLAAIEGGRIALHSASSLNVQTKESTRDIVTAIDLEVERRLLDMLADSAYPVLSEEDIAGSAYSLHEEKLTWVIDPIDGTANFVNNLEYFGISIGLCRGLDFPVGAVCIPRLEMLYSTSADQQALLNGQVVIHQHKPIRESLIAASFSGAVLDPSHRARQYELFGTINDQTRGCLRLGSTAVNICFTASGRLQCAYGLKAKIWDAAGALAIAIAAGCKVMVAPSGDQFSVDYIVGSRDTVAMIHEMCVARELMQQPFRIWEEGAIKSVGRLS